MKFLCPIKLTDRIHCKTCYFTRNGKCEHAKIIRERENYAKQIDANYFKNSIDSLKERK